ncbi:hypothetical protein LCGC14_1748060 [marine sediment metagenome]|uniref:Uncharacterized protein n=1 Tax=marine sediment metagenome TaxID=412755 RepID=A0A0F9HS32_9ZZZZ
METELFTCTHRDIIAEGLYLFYDVVLKKHIDEFPPGSTFMYAKILMSGYLILDTGDREYKYKLRLQVGEPIITEG